jgi:ubiquinone biosynthesis protein
MAKGELDMQKEAASLGFFHAAMDKDDLPHYAPAPFRELCAADVLTMEYVEGVSVRAILSAVHNDDQEQLQRWAADGITPAGVSRLIFRSVLEQSMRHRTFNADPHPSNLIINDRGRLNWVDFGLVGWLDEKQWSIQLRLRQAFLRGEVHAAYKLFLESVGPLPARDMRPFEVDMKQAIQDYIIAARDPDAPITQRSTGAFLMSTLGALRRYHLPMSTEVMQLYRAILIADIVMLRLDPQVDWLAEMDDFMAEFLAEQAENAVRSSVEDPSVFSTLLGFPSTLLAGADWLDRRLLVGPNAPAPQPSMTDELAAGIVRFICLVALVAIPLTVLFATGAITVAAGSPWHGIVEWARHNPVVAVIASVVIYIFLRRWSTRFRR